MTIVFSGLLYRYCHYTYNVMTLVTILNTKKMGLTLQKDLAGYIPQSSEVVVASELSSHHAD